MVAKKYQNPSGGLNEAGRKYFNRKKALTLKHHRNLEQMVDVLALRHDLLVWMDL
jgi:hypothetical protein